MCNDNAPGTLSQGLLHNVARYGHLTADADVLAALSKAGAEDGKGSVAFVAAITAAILVGGTDDPSHQSLVEVSPVVCVTSSRLCGTDEKTVLLSGGGCYWKAVPCTVMYSGPQRMLQC